MLAPAGCRRQTRPAICDAARVTAELDIYLTPARRWMRDGTLPALTLIDARGVPRRYVRLSVVWAALKCLYLVTRSLDPTGQGQARWAMR